MGNNDFIVLNFQILFNLCVKQYRLRHPNKVWSRFDVCCLTNRMKGILEH